MSYYFRAQEHVHNDWAVFPVQPDKRPYPGFTDWEQRATLSLGVIAGYWDMYPDALPAICPGRSGKVVIDIDWHPGKPDGRDSLGAAGVDILTPVTRPSLSGNGMHAYYRGAVGSVNGLLPGVDRKGKGGYIVAPYILPEASEVTTRLPNPLQGRKLGGGEISESPYAGDAVEWLREREGFTSSAEVNRTMREVNDVGVFRGHATMLRVQSRIIRLGALGHGGAPEALDMLGALWMANDHSGTEDPAREYARAMRDGILKYGGAA